MGAKTAEAAKTIHDFTSMTTRCYRRGERTILYSTEDMSDDALDSFRPYYPELKQFKSPVGCITTPTGFYFGFIRDMDEYLILGPVTDEEKTIEDLTAVAYRIDPTGKYKERLIKLLQDSPNMSIYSLLSMLTSTYKLINFREDARLDIGNESLYSSVVDVTFYNMISNKISMKQTSMESVFEGIIEDGNVQAMENWFRDNPIFHFSISITGDPLRDAKDCFILCTSLYAKAAHRGGLDRSYSLQLQLNAIRAMEKLTNEDEILMLQSNMAMEFTREVADFKAQHAKTKLVKDAVNMIQRNLYGTIKVEEIADSLFVSRGHLSKVFHKEMGTTISDFMISQKINEAKRMLRFSPTTLSHISDQLGFSSQSHFTKAFKKQTGMTPKQFRNSNHDLK